MHLKKTGLLLLLVPLLTACSSDPYAGEYVFQMGKNKDTHMKVSLLLSKEVYKEEDPSKGKKLELSFDMATSEVADEMSNMLKEFSPLNGYYRVIKDKKEQINKETRLAVGLNILDGYELPEELTEQFFAASITRSTVTFYIPVSFEDLTLQLYWYGFDFNIENIIKAITEEESEEESAPTDSPAGPHPIGSHPTAEDIKRINEEFKYGDSHGGRVFRDFHVLDLGLTKL